MNKFLAVAAAALSMMGNVYAQKTVSSKLESVGVFKNGLAVVRRTVKVPGDGVFRIMDVPEPIHGTFWIESDAKVVTKVSLENIEENGNPERMSISELFAGQNVTIHFKSGDKKIKGKLLKFEPTDTDKENWDRTYLQPGYRDYWGNYIPYRNRSANPAAAVNSNKHMILKTDKGIVRLDESLIQYIEADSQNNKITVQRPVMEFKVTGTGEKTAMIVINYLAKGIAWAPSYKIDLISKDSLTVEQKAVIKNEFGELEDTEIKLISGFPNIKFSHVKSPLNLDTQWSSFFSQLNQRMGPVGAMQGNVMTQQAVMYNRRNESNSPAVAGLDMSEGKGKGVDIYYHSAGKFDLKEGESMAFSVEKKETGYDRIIEWVVPMNWDENGRWYQTYYRRQNPDKFKDKIWDAVRFKNPFDFPMTTAVASIYDKEKFLGQNTSYWINPGAWNIQRITKALSVAVKSSEKEIKGKREVVYIGRDDYQKCKVEGKLFMKNHRDKPVKLLIHRKYYGKLIKAEGEPKTELSTMGVYSVNELNEMTWEIELEAGETKTLVYSYEFLANI